MNLGNLQIADLWLGRVQAKSAYIGNEQVWGGDTPTPPVGDIYAVKFTALEGNSSVVFAKKSTPYITPYVEYSIDGTTWASALNVRVQL